MRRFVITLVTTKKLASHWGFTFFTVSITCWNVIIGIILSALKLAIPPSMQNCWIRWGSSASTIHKNVCSSAEWYWPIILSILYFCAIFSISRFSSCKTLFAFVSLFNGHTATSGIPSDGPNGIFDSELISPGKTFTNQFDEEGTFDYYCIAHPWMTGKVTVAD